MFVSDIRYSVSAVTRPRRNLDEGGRRELPLVALQDRAASVRAPAARSAAKLDQAD